MSIEAIISEISSDRFLPIALPLFALALILESAISRFQQRELYEGKDFLVSMSMLVLSGIVDLMPKLAAIVVFYYLHELTPLRDVVQRQWWAWVLIFFLDDFVYYWFHRANHEVRIFWAGHVPHHSSNKLNFGTALRQGVGERIHKYFFWLPLPLLGFDAVMIFTMISLNLIYQFWVHTELVSRLPKFIEAVFNTPSHHRVHHGSNTAYLDRNHGGVLIIWDKCFGTFAKEQTIEPVIYGLTKNINTYNPIKVAASEYVNLMRDVVRAKNWLDKARYIFLAPGWSHDGPDLRANTQRTAIST